MVKGAQAGRHSWVWCKWAGRFWDSRLLADSQPSTKLLLPAHPSSLPRSYFTIASFVADHLDFHAQYLLTSGPRI